MIITPQDDQNTQSQEEIPENTQNESINTSEELEAGEGIVYVPSEGRHMTIEEVQKLNKKKK